MRRMVAALVALLTLALMVGCGSSSNNGSGGSGKSVAMVIPGSINDKGFNQSGYQGLQACKRLGLKTAYAENVQVPDYVRTFTTDAQANNVVIGHGFEFGDIAHQVAPKYPNVKFVVTSNPTKPRDTNVLHVMVNSVQGAYLAGATAGMVTKTNKLGGIAGFDFPVLKTQMAAFEAGAKSVNPKATLKVVYLGTFDDAAKGKEAAQSLAASGADVIYHIADAAGIGVINGAQAANVKAIGWGADQHAIAPKTVIASQIVEQATQIERVCKAIKDGTFKGGAVEVDGLKSGLSGISPLYNVPSSVQRRLSKVKQDIIDGKANVPSVGGGIPGSGPNSG